MTTKIGNPLKEFKTVVIQNKKRMKKYQDVVERIAEFIKYVRVSDDSKFNEYVPNYHVADTFQRVINALTLEFCNGSAIKDHSIIEEASELFDTKGGISDTKVTEVYDKLYSDYKGLKNNCTVLTLTRGRTHVDS